MKVRKTFADYLKDWLTPTMVFGAIVYGAWYGGNYIQESKGLKFDTPTQKFEVIQHTKEVPNAVDNYKQQQINIEQAKRLDSVYKFALDVFKDNAKNTEDAIRSRAKRDSLNKETQEIQKKILAKLNKLDSIR